MNLTKIPPHHYIHILDTNTNIPRLVSGPLTFLCREHETIIYGPKKMHVIPKSYYCVIENPIIIDAKSGKAELDKHGQAKLKHGQKEIRFEQEEPFPLYPGEKIVGDIRALQVVLNNEAFRIRALVDFTDPVTGVDRKSGDEYLVVGPATYRPLVEEEVVDKRTAIILKAHQALKLRARIRFVDRDHVVRKSGEEWLIKKEGTYILNPYEELLQTINATVLDEQQALIVEANKAFTGEDGVERKKGEKWLLTKEDTPLYIPPPEVDVKQTIQLTVLTNKEFCILENPMDADTGLNLLGELKLIRGPAQFFIKPGEVIKSIEVIRVLSPDDSIQVSAKESFDDTVQVDGKIKTIHRKCGTKWYVYGPCEYIPPLQVREIRRQKAIIGIEDLNIYIFKSQIIPFLALLIVLILCYKFLL